MAGDWIPMRVDLLDDPAVIVIAAAVGLDEYGVAGRLLKLWSWANRHLKDGRVSVPDKWVDDYTGTTGFAAAMLLAGWLRTRSGGGLEFTSFDRWNSNGAKIRLGETLRKRAFREKKGCPDPVPNLSRTKPGSGPGPEKRREEKRREEDKTPLPPANGGGDDQQPKVTIPPELDTEAFRVAWGEWKSARSKPYKPRGEAAALSHLATFGPAVAAEAIAASIRNSWQGLFPEKAGAGGGRASTLKAAIIDETTRFLNNGAAL